MKILTQQMLKRKNFQRFTYPEDMDAEMVDLMDVFNNIPGCRTLFCCCGHGSSGWYFSIACASEQTYHIIHSFLNEKKFELVDNGIPAGNTGLITEYGVSVYNKKLGQLPAKKRKATYVTLCEYFLQYVPNKHW